ncbi:Ras subfamily protein [Acanthamoeba castellanii str. Neff]|uniref:Ras subfamily protein n=1 Tax=Acanthamoeba castellanii (strain ATCC 30010 / Neff) TaxID=1257118 RepID=L8HGG9_ACACF|nr:Ras subfamily protein [Acanthamoeba castellanii str. Neff]ELR24614.1 Ras subfamily protein [Acanthamoeba castellanii str. Neff]
MRDEVKGKGETAAEREREEVVDLMPPELGWRIFAYLDAADLCRGFYRETCCEVWPPDTINSIDLRAEVIEAIKITLEWERDRVDKLNKARERYTAENRIRLSTTARPRFRRTGPGAKVVAVGDSGVGKTALLYAWSWNTFIGGKEAADYLPTCISFNQRDVAIDQGKKVVVVPWDTAGSADYDQLRPLGYGGADIFLLCYSVVDPQSLQNLRSRWLPEVRRHCPNEPFILVGCKKDLVSDGVINEESNASGAAVAEEAAGEEEQHNVDNVDAQVMAFEMGAVAFIECSAKTFDNVDATMALAANFAVYEPLDLLADRGQRSCLLQ